MQGASPAARAAAASPARLLHAATRQLQSMQVAGPAGWRHGHRASADVARQLEQSQASEADRRRLHRTFACGRAAAEAQRPQPREMAQAAADDAVAAHQRQVLQRRRAARHGGLLRRPCQALAFLWLQCLLLSPLSRRQQVQQRSVRERGTACQLELHEGAAVGCQQRRRLSVCEERPAGDAQACEAGQACCGLE